MLGIFKYLKTTKYLKTVVYEDAGIVLSIAEVKQRVKPFVSGRITFFHTILKEGNGLNY